MDENQILYTLCSVFAFVLGCVVGSFLNVCVYRLPKGESVVSPRSRCPKCGNSIAWYDNIPILSWLFLGAKCRHCGLPISWQYPLVEAITGTLCFLVFWRFGFTVATPIYMVLATSLVLVTFIDLTDWTIPNEVTLPGIPIGLGCALLAMFYPESGLRVLGPQVAVFNAIIGIVVGGGLLYTLDKLTMLLLKKRGMGFGDVKLLAMLGGFFGWPGVVLIIMIASLVGSLVGGITLLTLRNRKTRHEEARKTGGDDPGELDEDEEITLSGHYLPFGPYLCLAGLLVMFFGQEIYNAYVGYLTAGW